MTQLNEKKSWITPKYSPTRVDTHRVAVPDVGSVSSDGPDNSGPDAGEVVLENHLPPLLDTTDSPASW